jgi:hypothetical protein
MPGGQQPHRFRVIDATRVLGEEALLRKDVEAGKQAKPVVGQQGHHVALAFDRPELQGQRCPHGMPGGDHLRARQPGVLDRAVEMEPDQVRHKQKEAAAGGRKPARREREAPDVGDRLHGGPRPHRALVVQASGQRGKPFGLQDLADGRRTQRVLVRFQVLADFVDGVIPLAEIDDQVPRGRLLRLRLWAPSWRDKEDGVGLATEVVTQDVERGHRVAERAGGRVGGPPLHEVGAERLVLPLLRRLRLEEEAANGAYVFRCSAVHTNTVSPTTSGVKPDLRTPRRVAWDPLAEAYDEDPLAQGPPDPSATYNRANVVIRRP